jgi:catalase
VPGISFSPDKMLQARVFSYSDAHRYRVGTHYEMLPVNRPLNEAKTYHADGPMNFAEPKSTDAYYEPNSFGGPTEDVQYREPQFPVTGDGDRYNHLDDENDHYSQVTALFNLMNDSQKEQLFNNIAQSMEGVPTSIIQRQLALFEKVDSKYAAGVKKALK